MAAGVLVRWHHLDTATETGIVGKHSVFMLSHGVTNQKQHLCSTAQSCIRWRRCSSVTQSQNIKNSCSLLTTLLGLHYLAKQRWQQWKMTAKDPVVVHPFRLWARWYQDFRLRPVSLQFTDWHVFPMILTHNPLLSWKARGSKFKVKYNDSVYCMSQSCVCCMQQSPSNKSPPTHPIRGELSCHSPHFYQNNQLKSETTFEKICT